MASSLTSAPPIGAAMPSSSSSGHSSLHGSPTLAPKSPATSSPPPPSKEEAEGDAVADDSAAAAVVASSPKSEDAAAAASTSSQTTPTPEASVKSESTTTAVTAFAALSEVKAATESAAVDFDGEVEAAEIKAAEMPADVEMKSVARGAEGEAQPEGEEEEEEEEEEHLEGLADEEDEEKCCKLCNRKYEAPRILSCLHVFCTGCIANLVEGGDSGPLADFDDDDKMATFGADGGEAAEKLINGLTRLMRQRKKSAAPGEGDHAGGALVIHCPACQQETRLESGKSVDALPLDHVMAAMVRVNATEGDEEPVCTSCKDQGKAEASCQDCASFLCSQCVTAHRFMRCFENHSVVALEDLCSGQGDGTSSRVQQLMHKTPLTCGEHPTEILKHFCHTCSIPICNECLIGTGNHRQPQHKSDRIQDIEAGQKEELQLVLTQGRSKVEFCQKASTSLEARLGDLQLQRDQVKGQIEEAFHSYKALLEQRRETLMTELETSHKRQELAIMELFHSVEKTIEKIEDGARFAQRIVDNGNSPAVLSVKKLIVDQLLFLISTTPNPDLDVHLDFETNMAAFNDAVFKHFGHLNRPPASSTSTAMSANIIDAGSSQPFDVSGSSLNISGASGHNLVGGGGRFQPAGSSPAGPNNPGAIGSSPSRPFGSAIVGRDNRMPSQSSTEEDLASIFLNSSGNSNNSSQFAPGSARFRSSGMDDASSMPGNNAIYSSASGQFSNNAVGGRSVSGAGFTPFPNEVPRGGPNNATGAASASAAGNFKQPAPVSSASSGRGSAGLLDADISSLNQNQLTEYVQQMNDQLGSGLDVSGISQGLLANLADGLAGTNLLSNLDNLLSILSPDNATAAAAAADVVTSGAPQAVASGLQQRPSPLGHPIGGAAEGLGRPRHGGSSTSPGGAHHPTTHAADPHHRSSSRNSHSPTISESGISMDGSSQSGGSAGSGNASIASRLGINNAAAAAAAAANFGGNDAAAAAQALFSKSDPALGGVSINGNGQICLNGQAIPGVNINNLTGPAFSQLLEALPNNMGAGIAGGSASSRNPMDPAPHHQIPSNSRALSSVRDVSDAQVLLNCGVSTSGPSAPSMPSSSNSGGGSGSGGMNNNNNNNSNNSGINNSSSGVLSNIGYFDPSSTPRPTTPQMHSEFQDGMVSPNGSTGFGGSESGRASANRQQAAAGGGNGSAFTGGAHPPYPVRGPNSKCQAMQIRHKFGTLGPGKCQFNSPHGFCLGGEENIVVADTNNHRIQVFDKSGEFKFQFGIPGRDEGQLWYPRKVAVLRSTGKYVVCDRGNERSRMQIFTKNGHFIRKIAIRYIDIVAGLAIAASGNIVAVDSVSPTVFVIAESGELVRWFDCSDYMREPSDIAVSGKEFFVCDFKGHCVVVFSEEGQFLRRIGCENITNFPNGIDISDAGDVLVGDSHGNRFHVAVFQRDGSLLSEFECPYVKVSRCCGLKITSEGYVVTLAKNNHHVLVLNTLYIT